MATPGTTPDCWAAHMGLLACEPGFLSRAVALARAGMLKAAPGSAPMPRAASPNTPGEWQGDVFRPYWTAAGDGVAVIRISGPTAKAWGKFGEVSSVFMRRAVRAAVADPSVGSIVMVFDSPGGYVAGTDDLARDVAAANEVKPVVAYAEDLMASAAYYVGSQARKVYANASAIVGSIGTYMVLVDSSKQAEMEGVTVHVIRSGPLKGGGEPGTPITDEIAAEWQSIVDEMFAQFRAAVMRGRGMTSKAFDAVSGGGVWMASAAKELGLVDGIRSLDEVIAGMPKPRKSRAETAEARSRSLDL